MGEKKKQQKFFYFVISGTWRLVQYNVTDNLAPSAHVVKHRQTTGRTKHQTYKVFSLVSLAH